MTNISVLISQWCDLSENAQVVIITDNIQAQLAAEIKRGFGERCRIVNFEENSEVMPLLHSLAPSNLLLALFSFDAYIQKGANRVFSPFGKPENLAAKFAFLRLGISAQSLAQGLSTPVEFVYDKIRELHSYPSESTLRVTGPAGTDISLAIKSFETCEHRITADGGFAFLPPSETSAEVIPNSADGKIVVDITVGQLYYFGELLGYFGLADEPVTLTVTNGLVTDISGGKMAAEMKEKLFALPEPCRILVELGHGLSKMSPTGLIGVDESIIDTCHFGIGDGGTCGVHLDVVVGSPTIQLTS